MTNDNRLTPPGAFNSVLSEIAAERERQIAKGYDAWHDDQQRGGELISAAFGRIPPDEDNQLPDYRKAVVSAAAILVAEIQRLDRAKVAGNG